MNNTFISDRSWLLRSEIASLFLFLFFLPMFEVPKHLFLIVYSILNITRQFKTHIFFKVQSSDFVFIILFLSLFMSTIFSQFSGDEWHGFKSSLPLLIFGFLFTRSNYTKKTIKSMLFFSILSFTPTVLYGFYELFWLHKFYFLKIHSLGHVNASGLYITMIFSACVSLSLFTDKTSKRIIFTSFAILLYIALLFIQSRSAFAVSLFFISTLVVLFKKFRKELIFLSIILLGASFFNHAPVVEKQISQQKMGSVLAERDMIWNVALEQIRNDSSLLGIGPNNYYLIDSNFVKKNVEDRGEFYDSTKYKYSTLTHNIYLSFLIERGVFGLFALIVLMVFWAHSLLVNINNQNKLHLFFWTSSFGSFLSVFLFGFTHTTLAHESGLLAFFFFGLHQIYLRDFAKGINQNLHKNE
jgi:O-antigen ligase